MPAPTARRSGRSSSWKSPPADDGMVRGAHSSTGAEPLAPGPGHFARVSIGLVADGLEVVTVEIEHKCAELALVIVGSEPRRAVIRAARLQGQPGEFHDL